MTRTQRTEAQVKFRISDTSLGWVIGLWACLSGQTDRERCIGVGGGDGRLVTQALSNDLQRNLSLIEHDLLPAGYESSLAHSTCLRRQRSHQTSQPVRKKEIIQKRVVTGFTGTIFFIRCQSDSFCPNKLKLLLGLPRGFRSDLKAPGFLLKLGNITHRDLFQSRPV